jgi:hypothetical protein
MLNRNAVASYSAVKGFNSFRVHFIWLSATRRSPISSVNAGLKDNIPSENVFRVQDE